MKNLLSKYLLSLSLMALLTGCDEYLDMKSNFGMQTPNTLSSLQGLLDNSIDINFNLPAYGEISADNYFLLPAAYASVAVVPRDMYTWQNFVYNYNNDWASMYTPVYQCNVVLEQVEKIDGDVGQKNRIKGAALVYRANQFLHGMWTYAQLFDPTRADQDLGIVLRQTSDQNVPSKRSSVAECYALISNDLRMAIPLLPEQAESPMRPSKIAAYGLLARMYLSMAKYDSVYYYADKVLTVKNDLMDFNDLTAAQIASNFPLGRLNAETIFYNQIATSYPNLHPSFGLVDTVLYASYAANDIRKRAFFRPRIGYHSFKGTYTGAFNLFGGLAVDELYLMRAEANIRLGRIEEGLDDINTLLKNRIQRIGFVPYTGLDQEAALQLVMVERRKELLLRGLRWMDIKRYNKYHNEGIILKRVINGEVFTLEPNSLLYSLPLPDDVVQLTGIQQNP